MNVLSKAQVCECLPPLPSLHQVLLSLLLELKGETSDKEYDSTLARADNWMYFWTLFAFLMNSGRLKMAVTSCIPFVLTAFFKIM